MEVMVTTDVALYWLLGLLVLLLVVTRSLRFAPSAVSQFELERRLKLGDTSALLISQHREAVPILNGAVLVTTIVLSTAVAFTMVSLIPHRLLAAIFIVCALLLIDLIAVRVRPRLYRLQHHCEPYLISWLKRQRWLGWFVAPLEHDAQRAASQEELLNLIEKTTVVSTEKKRQLRHVLGFDTVLIRDIMTPKGMIVSIDASESIGPLVIDELHKSGHSRFPVIDGDVDHVVGMLYLHDLVALRSDHSDARSAMDHRVFYIKDNQMLSHALHAFLRTRHHLFIVVNSYRETVGLLSLEDVIEKMLGMTVVDEFDEFHDIRKVAEHNPRALNEPKKKVDI